MGEESELLLSLDIFPPHNEVDQHPAPGMSGSPCSRSRFKEETKEEAKETKPAAKGVCFTKGPKPSAKLFAKYTKKGDKCPCWWDITRDDCACCTKSEYQQCGWPMHKYCYKKEPKGKPQYGCPGVC